MSRLVERHRVTHLGVSPTLIRGMAAHEAEACVGDVGSIRLMITSGEAIAPEHFNWLCRTFGHGTAPLINYTGGTEASGALLASVNVKPIRPAGFNTVSPGSQHSSRLETERVLAAASASLRSPRHFSE